MNAAQQMDTNSFAALKASADNHVNLKSLLLNDANERIPNVNRSSLTKNFIKNCKRDAVQSFRVIRKLKGPKGNKPKYRLLFNKAIKSLTGNLSIQPNLTGPPYGQNLEETLKECSKCYYGRAMLYSFRPRDRGAFRLNANTFLKKMAPYEVEYRNKEKHVTEIGKLLFESYMDSAKHFEAKKRKNYLKHIEQQCNRAVTAMLMEAFSLQGQAKMEKWYTQYLKVKKIELTHNINWSFDQANTGRPRAGAFNQNQPLARKPFISMFRFAQLNTNVLVARSAIKKNRCILSQPILTAKWSNKLGACAQCNKQIKSNWSTPCSFCTQAAFCSNLCARTSALLGRHSLNKCANYCFRLGTAATLVHQLVELCGGPMHLSHVLSLTNTARRFPSTNECLMQSDVSVNIKATALLISGYADQLNGMYLAPELAHIFTEAIHLSEVLQIEYPEVKQVPDNVVCMFIFQLLRFVSGNPLACAKVGRPGAPERPATNNRPQLRKRRPKSYGFALGMMDSLFSFSCDANIRRQLNLRSGTIEYVAIKDIRQGDYLSISWQARKQEPGSRLLAFLHDGTMTKRFMKAQVQDCLFCKTKGIGGTVVQ